METINDFILNAGRESIKESKNGFVGDGVFCFSNAYHPQKRIKLPVANIKSYHPYRHYEISAVKSGQLVSGT